MIAKLAYVRCDLCGLPVIAAQWLAPTAAEARRLARRAGFIQTPSLIASGPRTLDICPSCVTKPPSPEVTRADWSHVRPDAGWRP